MGQLKHSWFLFRQSFSIFYVTLYLPHTEVSTYVNSISFLNPDLLFHSTQVSSHSLPIHELFFFFFRLNHLIDFYFIKIFPINVCFKGFILIYTPLLPNLTSLSGLSGLKSLDVPGFGFKSFSVCLFQPTIPQTWNDQSSLSNHIGHITFFLLSLICLPIHLGNFSGGGGGGGK